MQDHAGYATVYFLVADDTMDNEMNINDLNDNEKSVMLAKLCGWETKYDPPAYGDDLGANYIVDASGIVVYNGRYSYPLPYPPHPDLYDPANMALAWRVLNWAERYTQKDEALTFYSAWVDFADDKFSLFAMLSPEKAQRAWLDKILELAIEAGMISDES